MNKFLSHLPIPVQFILLLYLLLIIVISIIFIANKDKKLVQDIKDDLEFDIISFVIYLIIIYYLSKYSLASAWVIIFIPVIIEIIFYIFSEIDHGRHWNRRKGEVEFLGHYRELLNFL
tara:strand:+ start:424 stop:777 length:354 start_codon:yes stop_codon:yes gene_type:complete